MSYFYVDFENVKVGGLDGIESLLDGDTVKVYYSQEVHTISIDDLIRINASKASFKHFRIDGAVKTLKNAIDVKILIDVCSNMRISVDIEHFIVSNDKDYDKFIEEKLKEGFKVGRISKISEAKGYKFPRAEEAKTIANDESDKEAKSSAIENKTGKAVANQVTTATKTVITQPIQPKKEAKSKSAKKPADQASQKGAKQAIKQPSQSAAKEEGKKTSEQTPKQVLPNVSVGIKMLIGEKGIIAFLNKDLPEKYRGHISAIACVYMNSKNKSEFHNKLREKIEPDELAREIYSWCKTKSNMDRLFES